MTSVLQETKTVISSSPLLLQNFCFKDKFVGLTDLQFQSALDIVNTMFTGVRSLWRNQPEDEKNQKRNLCLSYLVGWQLVQLYPDSAPGISSMGAVPLSGKRIDNIDIRYKNVVRQQGSVLDALTTNYFGIQALLMIQSAPETYELVA